MSKNGLNKKGRSVHSEELRFTLDSAGRGTAAELLRRLKPYRFKFALSLGLSLVYVFLTLLIPVLAGKIIDCIIGAGRVDFAEISPFLLKLGAAAAGAALSQWLVSLCNNSITYGCVRNIRAEAFRRIQKLPLAYFDSHPAGETVSRMLSDADQLADGLLMGFSQLFTGIMIIIGTLVFMLTVNPLITLVVVAVTPLSLAVASFISKRTYSMFRKQSETRGEQTALIDEFIGEQKLIRAFSYEARAEERFNAVNEKLQKFSLRAVFFSSLTNPCTRFVNAVIYAGVAVSGAFSVLAGGLTVGGLSAFLSYANQYTKPFNEISGVVTELQSAFASARRIFALTESDDEISDADNKVLTDVSGNVKIDHVDFSYVPEKELIKDLNLDVNSGQQIAIVGPTGCGKTTIINLLMRFYDVNSGQILLDNHDVRDYNRRDLRKAFGMVLQDTWLYKGTIMENIRYGRLDATDEEVIEAAKAAHADSFIRTLPGGYNMELNEDASNVSQGQKQLLTIARAILADSRVMILDEATSSVDTRTEALIQKAMDNLMEGRTSFVIAHRLSTIKNADVILVMKDGDIIEQGNHDTLLAQNGFYATLYNSQFDQG
mgnify:CR=1 FL=1